MSDDTDDTPSHSASFMQRLMRKFMFLLGLCFLLWILVNKYAPHLVSPSVGPGATQATPKDLPRKERAEMLAQQKKRMAELRGAPDNAAATAAASNDEVTQLRSRIEELEARMKQYEGKQAPAAAAPEGGAAQPQSMADADKQHIVQLQEQLIRQKDVLAAMKAQIGEQANGSRQRTQRMENELKKQQDVILALKNQIGELQSQGAQKLASMTAFGFLKEAILRGEPFSAQLAQLGQNVQDPRAGVFIGQFGPYAEKGIMTLPALQQAFSGALEQALAARKDNSFSQNLQSLIRIRKVGEQQQGSDDESVLARAEAKLARGDVGASISEIVALSPPAADAFAAWMKQAEAFVLVRNHLDALQMAITEEKPVAQPVAAAPEETPAPAPEPAAEPVAEPVAEAAPQEKAPETPEKAPVEKAPVETPPAAAPESVTETPPESAPETPSAPDSE